MTTTKKLLVYAGKTTCWILRFGYFLLAVAVIFLSAYYFGHDFLFGLKGGDTAFAISIIRWFDHWFPNIPLWFPMQGGGVSYIYGYQFVSHLGVVLLHRLSQLSLENSYQLIGFLSVPLTSLGIYLFVWTRLKNQTIAWIAAFFYFLSPLTWTWLFDWGFFGESVSYLLIPPTLIFFDLFLCSVLEWKFNFKARLWFVLAVICLFLLWFTHSISFLGMVFFFPFYGLLYPLLFAKTQRIKKAAFSLLAVFIFFAATYLLAAFQMVHFQYYAAQSKTAGTISQEFFFKDAADWYLKPFLSLEEIPIDNRKHAEQNVAIAIPIWTLAILGFAGSFWLSKKLFVIGLFSGLSFLFVFYPAPVWRILNLTGAQHYRPLIISLRIFLPILAAFGAMVVPYFFWSFILSWRKFLGAGIAQALLHFRFILVALSSVAFALGVVLIFRYYGAPPAMVRYGPGMIDFGMVDDLNLPYVCPSKENVFWPNICKVSAKPGIDKTRLSNICDGMRVKKQDASDLCQESADPSVFSNLVSECKSGRIEIDRRVYCQAVLQPLLQKLDLANWPKPRIEGDVSTFTANIYKDYLKAKAGREAVRIDVSPSLGGVTQTFGLDNFSDSMVALYAYQASLNHSFWGYEQTVFYGKNTSSASIYNAAKWFGIEYILLNKDLDPLENFQQDEENWQEESPGIFRFKKASGLYSFSTTKPVSLVIGSEKKAAYETFFRLGSEGILPYDDTFLVQGKENIDDYSLEELKKFDALILFGYSYKDQGNAFKLLDQYIKEGGKVFLDTGWQYTDRDWQIEKAPDFFPVKDLVWSTSHTTASKYRLENSDISKEVDVAKFSPLKWADQSWGVSVPKSGVRDWGKVILASDNDPLVVLGNYGKGKIVWSGVNWMGHISTYDFNREEIKFLNKTLGWLFGGQKQPESDEKKGVVMNREFPDRVEFSFENGAAAGGTFYFRESYHPDWQAYLVTGNSKSNLPIYKSGPLYKLIKMPQLAAHDKLVFEYSNGLRGILATLVSLLTLAASICYLVLGKRAVRGGFRVIKVFLRPVLSYAKKRHLDWKEEE